MLLGDRRQALRPLLAIASDPASPWRERALRLVPRLLASGSAQAWFRPMADDPAWLRSLIAAIGTHGDPRYVPWLIRQMGTPPVARVAGEAFSMITGVDLAYEDLEGEWPEGFTAGPTEDPEDEDVAMDPDEDLPVAGAGAGRALVGRRTPTRFPADSGFSAANPSPKRTAARCCVPATSASGSPRRWSLR